LIADCSFGEEAAVAPISTLSSGGSVYPPIPDLMRNRVRDHVPPAERRFASVE